MVLAFMGLTSSRDVTVSRTLPTWTESRPTLFPTTDPTGACRLERWCTARRRAISASPLPHLDW